MLLPDWANKILTEGQKGKLDLCSSHHNHNGIFLLFRLKAQTTVFKKVKTPMGGSVVIPLTLNRNTVIYLNSFSPKFRASKAFVQKHFHGECYSSHDNKFKYNSETVIKPSKPFELNTNTECATGVHFFFNRRDAENYSI